MKPTSSMSTFLSSLEAETSCGMGALCMATGAGLPNVCKCQMGFLCGPDGSCRARSAQDVARHFDTFEKETPETPVRNGTRPFPWLYLWFLASLNFRGVWSQFMHIWDSLRWLYWSSQAIEHTWRRVWYGLLTLTSKTLEVCISVIARECQALCWKASSSPTGRLVFVGALMSKISTMEFNYYIQLYLLRFFILWEHLKCRITKLWFKIFSESCPSADESDSCFMKNDIDGKPR